MRNYKVALIGFGGVNRAFAELVATKNDTWERELGFRLEIVAVSDLALGSVVSPNGLDAATLVRANFPRGGFGQLSGGRPEADNETLIKTAPADIVVEATFTNPDDGEPAVSHCRWALEAGRHVVTTNKGPVAIAGRDLKALAKANGVRFEYEGSVMSGTPVIRLAEQTLAGAEVASFEGILNGTSNFVLDCMASGLDLASAVREAQGLGYAEADPTSDLEGFDVRLKVVILANELLGANLKPEDVACSGIAGLSRSDIREAARARRRWKLIGSAARNSDGSVAACVSARRLPVEHPLAGVRGAANALCVSTELLGAVTISGPGAGRTETAYAVLSDIVAIHAGRSRVPAREAA